MHHVRHIIIGITFCSIVSASDADTVVLSPGGDIQAAVDALEDGDVLRLQEGVFEIPETIDFGSKTVQVIGAVDPDGRSLTVIDGGGTIGLASVGPGGDSVDDEAAIEFKHLIFASGMNEESGGAIDVRRMATFEHCTFRDNVSGEGGGAVWIDETSADFLDCTFTDNRASGPGGAVDTERAGVLFVRCAFQGNESSLGVGGAIAASRSYLELAVCSFRGNTCGMHGGAIWMRSGGEGFSWFRHCVFEANEATVDGGAVKIVGGFEMENCRFFGNIAGFDGGAFWSSNFGSITYLDECEFRGNRAGGDGGHLWAFGSRGFADDCIFDGGTAGGSGGGIYLRNHEGMPVFNGRFTDNHALAGGGGAIGLEGSLDVDGTLLEFRFCEFTGNSAAVGGACFDLGGSPIFGGCTFSKNVATSGPGGVGYHLGSGRAWYDDSTMSGNESAEIGGALYFAGPFSWSIVQRCEIRNNTALNGAAIRNVDSALEIGSSTICGDGGGQIASENGFEDLGGNSIGQDCRCADVNGDGRVDAADMAEVLSGWGSSLANLDVSGDGRVDSADLALVLAAWGNSC